MLPKLDWRLLQPLLVLLFVSVMLLGCSSMPTFTAAPCPKVPALPVEVRQPPTPTYCSPDCSTNLGTALSNWRLKLTAAASPEQPASGGRQE